MSKRCFCCKICNNKKIEKILFCLLYTFLLLHLCARKNTKYYSHRCSLLRKVVFFKFQGLIYNISTVFYKIQELNMSVFKCKKPLLRMVAFDAWVTFHYRSHTTINCPILHDVGPTPPLAFLAHPLDHTPTIPHTYAIQN